jgi:hypothetical protein
MDHQSQERTENYWWFMDGLDRNNRRDKDAWQDSASENEELSAMIPCTCRVPHLGESGVFGVFLV